MIKTTDTQKEVGFIHTKHNGDMVNIDRIMTKKDGQMVQVFEQGFTREQETTVLPLTTISKTIGKNLKQYEIYGNSEQDGIPDPDNPIEIKSVGDKTDDTPHRYKIPITVTNGTDISTTNIYLNEPLREIGDYADYIDFKNQKVVRRICEKSVKDIPTSSWFKSTTYPGGYYVNKNKIVPNGKLGGTSLKGQYGFLCNYAEIVSSESDYEIGTCFEDGSYNFRLFSNAEMPSISDWVNYLNSHDLKMLYVLETPIEEPISLPQISTVKNGKSTFNILTETQPSDFKIIYKGAGTFVKGEDV